MTITKLNTLAPEQAALLPQIRDQWIRDGLSTEPANRAAAEAGVRKAYEAAGLEPPRLVIWLDSPFAGALGQGFLRSMLSAPNSGQVWGQVWDQVWDQVRGQVWGQVWDQVRGQVWDQVWDQVRGQVWDQVSDQVWGQVSDQVWGQVWDQVRGQVWDQVSDQVWGQVSGQVWGQVWGQVSGQVRGQVWDQVSDQVKNWNTYVIGRWEIGVLSFCDAFAQLGIDTSKANGLIEVERNADWWWPMAGAVVITDRPTLIARDKDGRLHNATGPAFAYRDGFKGYLWHGTRVPEDLIETGWDIKRIMSEKNAEVRRCAIERMGWDQFIEAADMTQIGDTRPDPGNAPHTVSLWELPDNLRDLYEEHARILLCTNGSPERDGSIHKFGLVVPGHHEDPVAAAADLYGIPTAAYAQLQVRR
ncbi:DUF4816 domain-containing protein [Williamsia sp. DF01-3]|uniref:DUF4816 domain-containing protein n=1 Tax=Williamsia sp. DF01-3 TaxID=2934157 RepID=UPI001FF39E9A|nr:DUF4816 domain-containing protein [Williamsia sp. DF01-3]MCK0517907.1 DUF4816 domain-containing protein [Williamsia sp. DF01-3]